MTKALCLDGELAMLVEARVTIGRNMAWMSKMLLQMDSD